MFNVITSLPGSSAHCIYAFPRCERLPMCSNRPPGPSSNINSIVKAFSIVFVVPEGLLYDGLSRWQQYSDPRSSTAVSAICLSPADLVQHPEVLQLPVLLQLLQSRRTFE
jgi:hypothetical protein